MKEVMHLYQEEGPDQVRMCCVNLCCVPCKRTSAPPGAEEYGVSAGPLPAVVCGGGRAALAQAWEVLPLKKLITFAAALLLLCVPVLAFGSGGGAEQQAVAMPGWLCIPFAGLLLCIAVFPLVCPVWWEDHQGWVVAFWSLLFRRESASIKPA